MVVVDNRLGGEGEGEKGDSLWLEAIAVPVAMIATVLVQ